MNSTTILTKKPFVIIVAGFFKDKTMDLMKKYLSRVRSKGRVKEVETITDETLQDIYLEVMSRLNDSYIEGTIKYIQDHHKELDIKIDEVDKQLNKIWESCLQGKTGLDDFKEALDIYQNLYLKAIRFYKIQNAEKTIKC